MQYTRTIQYYLRRWVRAALRTNDSPKQIAGGAAIGMFFAVNPTVGSQMLVSAVVATLFRCSRIPAMAMAYVSNPVTAIPIYGGAYMIGAWIVRLFGFRTVSYQRVMQLFTKPDEPGLWGMLREKAGEMASLGWAGLVPMEIGATILGAVLAVATYYVSLRFITGHRLLKAQRMALRAKRRLERVRSDQQHEAEQPSGVPHD